MYTISGHARASAAIVVWKFGRRIWRARYGGGRADGRSVGAAAVDGACVLRTPRRAADGALYAGRLAARRQKHVTRATRQSVCRLTAVREHSPQPNARKTVSRPSVSRRRSIATSPHPRRSGTLLTFPSAATRVPKIGRRTCRPHREPATGGHGGQCRRPPGRFSS